MKTSAFWIYLSVFVLAPASYVGAMLPEIPMWEVWIVFGCGLLSLFGAYVNARLSSEV